MVRLIRKKHLVVIILLGILLFHFFNNFIWLKKDNRIDGPDSGWHLIESVKFYLAFKKILYSTESFFAKTEHSIQAFGHWPTGNWPPLIYFLSALINPHEFSLFRIRMYLNFIFYILLILSTYFLGKKCFNRRVGLIAAFLISFYPAVCAFSRQFGLDFPLFCLTATCVCLLVYAENFSKRGYSLLFGLSLGIAMLVKLQILFFLLMPLLYIISSIFSEKNSEKLKAILNLILSLTVAFILFYLYWGNKLGFIFSNFYEHAFTLYPFYTGKRTPALGPSTIPVFSLRNITFYLEGLLYYVSLFPFILFVCALVAILVSKNKWRLFFLLSLLVPYFIITFISVKWTRYALPLLVFMAVITAWSIDSLRLRYLKVVILCALVFNSMRLCFFNSWTINRLPYVPCRFFQTTIKDSVFPRLYPPDPYDYTRELEKDGVIPHIEQGLRDGKKIRIEFGGDSVEVNVALLYIYFQDDIFNNRIDIRSRMKLDFQDVDYIVLRSTDLLNKKELLKNYMILSRAGECVVLIKK